MSLAAAAILDVTLVLALALVVAFALRRRSAALRHAVVGAALAAAAAAPALELLMPALELPIARGGPAQEVSTLTLTSGPVIDGGPWMAVPARDAFSWLEAIRIAWMLGAIVVFGGLITGVVRLARETRRCTVIRSGPWRELADRLSPHAVTLLESNSASLLLTCGFWRPKILLPVGARSWSAERRGVVLAHELAHIRRGDWALQLLGEALRAIYWFNPLVWVACRRLRLESEYACDDAVLEAGIDATDYATHLLDVARQAIGDHDMWASAPAVANPSTLERRIAAMLNHTRNRHPLSRRARVCALATALVVAAPIAAIAITQRTVEPVTAVARTDVALVAPTAFDASEPVTPPAAPPARPHARSATRAAPAPVLAKAPAGRQQAPASISGVMSDASGAVLPGVELTLTDAASGVVYSRVSDGTGAFTFPDLPPGRYALVAALAGFAAVTVELTLAPGERVQRRLSMRIGGLVETITVGCAPEGGALPRPARGVMAFERRAAMARLVALSQDAPLAQDQPGPKPVRVGGQIRAPQKLKDVRPICPRLLLPPQEGTVVILEAVIGPDGYTHDIRPLRPQSSTEFVESAMEAVRQWQFTPTRLNNSPVPVIMTVTVLYQRM